MTVQRFSLVDQAGDILKDAIASGRWKQWLPSERETSRQLGISRTSYRLALQTLTVAGLIKPEQGKGTRILRKPGRPRVRAGLEIGLIAPHSTAQLRPSVTLWIMELRARLAAAGHTLRTFHGDRFYSRNPGPALRALARDHPAACWILVMSTRPAQEWFAENRVPCVVAGTVHGDISLPFVDVDLRAVCRHAAGVLFAAGHRHIALLNRRLPGPTSNQLGAGDREGETGFREAAQSSPGRRGRVTVVYHKCSVTGVAEALRPLLTGKDPVTGIVVSDPYCYLAAISYITEQRLCIPEDVSVISRDHDAFLEYVYPAPARYVLNADTYAHRVFAQVQHAMRKQATSVPAAKLFPAFIPGESVGGLPVTYGQITASV